jgi:LPS-assembly protein
MVADLGGNTQAVVDPIVQLTAAPRLGDDPEIPNEESTSVDFTEANLLRASRFTGIDRLETGSRVTYGLETGVFGIGGGFSDLFVGQSYRLTDDQDFPVGSGLEGRFSDVVGRFRVQPNPYLNTTYRFRLDEDDFTTRLSELTATGGTSRLNGSVQYRYVGEIQGPNGSPSQESVAIGVGSALTENWSVSAAQSRNLITSQPLATVGTVTYADECLVFQLIASRDHTYQDVEGGGGVAVFFRLVFKNLGEVEAPLLGGNSATVQTPGY